MESIIAYDHELFLLINQGLSSGFLDAFLPISRNPYFWIPLYIFLVTFMLINFGKKGFIWVVALICVVVFADYASSKVIKYEVQRLRPCQELGFREEVNLKVICGSGYSFTSSHATNNMAFASFIINTTFFLFGRWRWIMFIWAFVIGFAQIYVGVHFPLDVLMGFILGWIIGHVMGHLYKKTSFRFHDMTPAAE